MKTLLILFGPAILTALVAGGLVNFYTEPGGVWGAGLPALITGIFCGVIVFLCSVVYLGIRTAF